MQQDSTSTDAAGFANELRFDVYTVFPSEDDFLVTQFGTNLPLIGAVALAGVHEHDFQQSVEHTGWVGTCPDWTYCLPVVTVPHQIRLGMEQLQFIAEECGYGTGAV